MRRVAVVGSSLAGLRACEELRALGFDGGLALIGAEIHAPYDRPPLSKQFLAGKWDRDRITLRTPDKIDGLDLDLRLGVSAEHLDLNDRSIDLSDGTTLPFDGLVIATGSTPRSFPVGPGDAEGIYTLRTLDDSLRLQSVIAQSGARLVVIGAGFIGSEVSSTAHDAGASVTVIEAAPVPLEHALGREMGEVCGHLQRDAGVDLRLGIGVEHIRTSSGHATGVELADGSVVEADAVLVAIGVSPTTGWLDGSGLQITDGVVCDETLHAAPGVVAAGDIVHWPHATIGHDLRLEHWENAVGQGAHAAASLLAGPIAADPFVPVPYFWSDQYGTKIQLVGHPEPDAEVRVVEGSLEEKRFVALYGHGNRLVAALTFGRPRLLVMYRRLLEERVSFEEALAYEPA